MERNNDENEMLSACKKVVFRCAITALAFLIGAATCVALYGCRAINGAGRDIAAATSRYEHD